MMAVMAVDVGVELWWSWFLVMAGDGLVWLETDYGLDFVCE